jgi:hypothetical protein
MKKSVVYKMLILWIFFISSFLYAYDQAKVGEKAPDFTAEAYFPNENKFGKISLSQLTQKEGKWVVLFFYPADFTFA